MREIFLKVVVEYLNMVHFLDIHYRIIWRCLLVAMDNRLTTHFIGCIVILNLRLRWAFLHLTQMFCPSLNSDKAFSNLPPTTQLSDLCTTADIIKHDTAGCQRKTSRLAKEPGNRHRLWGDSSYYRVGTKIWLFQKVFFIRTLTLKLKTRKLIKHDLLAEMGSNAITFFK